MIYQLDHRCWHLDPPPDVERDQHFDTLHDADEALRDLREECGPDPLDLAALENIHAKQADAPCWLIRCDGECEQVIDTDEGWISHHDSLADAMDTLKAYEWKYVGDLVFCEEDAPSDGQPPPLSPAELEAAGQLPIPGIIP